ncbi:MAG TPA: DMT family transporter [Nitrososphaerales archaeon]|nr:DMT family transporter [Nitrososphaerales archaeon]
MSSIAPSASASRLRKSVAGYSGLIVLSLIWGMAFVAIKQADSELSPVNLALIRWFIASACYLVLIPLIGRWKTRLQRRDIPRLLAIAFSNVAGYHISLYYAETTVSAGLAGILISFGPVFVVILSHFLLNEKAGRRILLGLLLAVVGTLVLSVSTVNLADFASLYGPAEVILSAAFYALFTVLSKPLVHRYGAPPITIWSGLIGTTMMLPLLSQSFVSQLEVLSAIGWASVLYLSVLSTVLGYLLFFTLVSRGAVSRLSIQLFLAPMVSVAGGALLLSEPVSAATVVGGGMMLVAVGLVTGIKRK